MFTIVMKTRGSIGCRDEWRQKMVFIFCSLNVRLYTRHFELACQMWQWQPFLWRFSIALKYFWCSKRVGYFCLRFPGRTLPTSSFLAFLSSLWLPRQRSSRFFNLPFIYNFKLCSLENIKEKFRRDFLIVGILFLSPISRVLGCVLEQFYDDGCLLPALIYIGQT